MTTPVALDALDVFEDRRCLSLATVRQAYRPSSSVSGMAKKSSATGLCKASPTVPMEPRMPAFLSVRQKPTAVLGPAHEVVNESRFRSTVPDRHIHPIDRQTRDWAIIHRPTHEHPGKRVDYSGQV